MNDVVLVHGSFHNGSCWAQVAQLLEEKGHRVQVVTLSGQKGGNSTSPFRLTLKSYRDDVLQALRRCRRPAMLVGHSMGGMPISAAAEMVPDKIAKLVYLTALVPKGNRARTLTAAKGDPEVDLSGSIHLSLFKGSASMDREESRRLFYHDCDFEAQERALDQLGPQPLRPLLTSVALTDENYGRVPKAFIECRLDRTLSLSFQQLMQTRQGFDQVLSLDSSHSPFLSQPEQLVDCLTRLM